MCEENKVNIGQLTGCSSSSSPQDDGAAFMIFADLTLTKSKEVSLFFMRSIHVPSAKLFPCN